MPEDDGQTVLCNTSPLFYLYRVDLLWVLRRLYGCIATTPEVADELLAGQDEGLEVPDVHGKDWIICREVAVPQMLALISDLGRGEASVLALALEEGSPLVILDDQLARRVAKFRDLALTGTLGVLLKAKKQCLLDSISPYLNSLEKDGFYVTPELLAHMRYLANEA